uniref:inactive tyrosine-protein kinase PEAK1-like n=1 Tax=Semicossyphus pulcher TaxID=241346 RepID=UPI0037E91D7B
MATGPGEQPPALPIKQHRSRSSRCSSVESDCAPLSPVVLQHPNHFDNDVFPEPTDCHAAQCPIHQRYDPSQHQVRFFSDGTPPPVPKKRLARTLSLPAPHLSPLPPLSPLQRRPQNFDNPLYMLAPIQDTYFHEETEEFEAARGSPVPSLSLSQLSFDTPDEHLPLLFGSFDDQRVVFQGIQHRHLLFLRSMAQSIEAGILLQREAAEGDVSSYQPQDFLLCKSGKPKQIRETVYYSLHSTKFPGRVLALREHKHTDGASSAHTKHQPPHVNVQDVVAHFQSRNDSNVFQTQDPSHPVKSACTAAKPPGGDSTESAADLMNINLPSVHSFLLKGHSVSIERDLPLATLEDFVQDGRMIQGEDCLDYDRQVCVLLLQVLTGSQHLYNTSATAAELGPQEIFLVWPSREKDEGGNKDASEMMKEERRHIEMLWRSHGSPRVVLTPLSPALSAPAPLTYIKSQIRALIHYCLDSHESQTSLGSHPARSKSSYRAGLLHLASLLQSEVRQPKMSDMLTMLQVLLWGPHVPLHHRGHVTTAVHNWLTIKRALLVMKFAERGLIQDQSALDWEDCLCLQYLSFTDPEMIVSVARQLWLALGLD